MRAVLLGATALGLGLAAGTAALQGADSPLVTIAVLRGDGVLIPIVTRSGSKWTHTWPVPAKAVDVPIGLDGVPKRWWGKPGPSTTWHAWQIDGSTADVAAERPAWYLAHCQQGVGLQTALTARPPLPPPTTQPYPKLGLAATATISFRPIEPVDQSDRMWQAVAEQAEAAMKQAEDAMTGLPSFKGPTSPAHPIPPAERAKVPTRVESLYRLPLESGKVLYYVEATKRYGMPPMPADRNVKAPTPERGCSLMTFGGGFFLVPADGVVPPLTLDVRQASCDYDGVSLMLPLGAVGADGDAVWIGQVTGWDYESYAGFRWDTAAGQIADVFFTQGGWCPRDGGW